MSKDVVFLSNLHDYLMKVDNSKLFRMLAQASHNHPQLKGKSVFEIELDIKIDFERRLKFNDELDRASIVNTLVSAFESNNSISKVKDTLYLDDEKKYTVSLLELQDNHIKDMIMNFDFMITKNSLIDIREFYSDFTPSSEKSKIKNMTLSDKSSIKVDSDGLFHINDGEKVKFDSDNMGRYVKIISTISKLSKSNTSEKTM